MDDDLREDMGSAVSRKIEIFETVLSTKADAESLPFTLGEEVVDTEISAKAIFESLELHAKPNQVHKTNLPVPTKQVLNNEGANSLVKRPAEDSRLPGPKVKKKKKKDAIDDIFGGL